MEKRKYKIIQKELSMSLEVKLKERSKDLTTEDLKSIINQIEDPITKLIANKYLLNGE